MFVIKSVFYCCCSRVSNGTTLGKKGSQFLHFRKHWMAGGNLLVRCAALLRYAATAAKF